MAMDPPQRQFIQEIYLLGEVETFYPERRLKELTEEIKRRCIISATIGAGTELTTELKVPRDVVCWLSESSGTRTPSTRMKLSVQAAPTVFKSSMGVWMDHHH